MRKCRFTSKGKVPFVFLALVWIGPKYFAILFWVKWLSLDIVNLSDGKLF